MAGEQITRPVFEEAQRRAAPCDPINLNNFWNYRSSQGRLLLSHRNLLLNAYYAARGQRLAAHDRICIPVPLYHCFGCVLGTMCVHGERRGDGLSTRELRRRGHASRRRVRALHRDLWCAYHVHCRVGASHISRPRHVVATDGNHGRQSLSDEYHCAASPTRWAPVR